VRRIERGAIFAAAGNWLIVILKSSGSGDVRGVLKSENFDAS